MQAMAARGLVVQIKEQKITCLLQRELMHAIHFTLKRQTSDLLLFDLSIMPLAAAHQLVHYSSTWYSGVQGDC
jgi:hypothetical protein